MHDLIYFIGITVHVCLKSRIFGVIEMGICHIPEIVDVLIESIALNQKIITNCNQFIP